MSRDFDELLSAYLDGEVTPEERAVVERRLEQSPALRETLDELSEVGDLIRALPRPRPPVDLPERVVAAISQKPLASSAVPASRSRQWRTWPLLTAGTVIAAGVAVVVLLPNQNPAVGRRVATDAALPGIELASTNASAAPASPVADLPALGQPGSQPSPQSESLSAYFRRLDRAPRPGEVLSTLVNNAGQTQVLRYVVVDTREAAGTVNTILVNNSFDIVVTETPSPAPALADAQGPMYWYVEGPAGQVGKSLQEIETLTTGKVDDLGLLADFEQMQAVPLVANPTPAPGGIATTTERDAASSTQKASETVVGSPIADPAPIAPELAADQATPLRRDAQPPAGRAQADELARPAAARQAVPSQAGEQQSNLGMSLRSSGAPVSNTSRGVSAQLDSQSATPIVENMLRGRTSNSFQRSYNFQETQRGSLQRNSGNAIGGAEAGRQLSGNQLNENAVPQAAAGNSLELKQQPEGEASLFRSPDPRNAPTPSPSPVTTPEEPLIRALIILEPEPAAAAPAEKKAAN